MTGTVPRMVPYIQFLRKLLWHGQPCPNDYRHPSLDITTDCIRSTSCVQRPPPRMPYDSGEHPLKCLRMPTCPLFLSSYLPSATMCCFSSQAHKAHIDMALSGTKAALTTAKSTLEVFNPVPGLTLVPDALLLLINRVEVRLHDMPIVFRHAVSTLSRR